MIFVSKIVSFSFFSFPFFSFLSLEGSCRLRQNFVKKSEERKTLVQEIHSRARLWERQRMTKREKMMKKKETRKKMEKKKEMTM